MAPEPRIRHRDDQAEVRRVRGLFFKFLCLAATLFGISVVSIMFLYVAIDAFRPSTADPGWYLVFLGVFVLPSFLFMAGVLFRDFAAARIAAESVGVPIVGILVGGALIVLFRELITPEGWVGLVLAGIATVSVVTLHRRYRREAALERLGILILAPVLTVFGIPALSIDYTLSTPLTDTELVTIAFSIPTLVPSVRDLIPALPVLPPDWFLLGATITVPLAYMAGRIVADRREDERGVREALAGGAVITVGAASIAPSLGVPPLATVLLLTGLAIPGGTYVEGVFRRRTGTIGLAFPVVVVGGILIGTLVTASLGYAGPDAWLDWSFLTSATSWQPEEAGIYPALVGSVLIVVVIALTAFPLGVGAAIYLEEYAPTEGRLARIVGLIEINIGNLAGVPSVVYGLLGLALFVQGIGLRAGIVLVGGLTVGLLVLPIVIISAQEAIRSVPDSFRRGSYAMGASRWQTVRRVVLPEAMPGILTGTILALGRAIGETAPLLMIGVAASVRATPNGFFDKTGAMPRQIFTWSSEIEPEFRFGVLAAGVITLLIVLLLMNGTAIVLRNKYQRQS